MNTKKSTAEQAKVYYDYKEWESIFLPDIVRQRKILEVVRRPKELGERLADSSLSEIIKGSYFKSSE